MRPTRIGLVAALALAPVMVFGQSSGPPQQKPTFRSELNIVPLSVTVLDRQGRPVMGLKAADFTVTEDGKPREILSFSQETISAGPVAPLEPAVSITEADTFQPETRRTFLLVLGYGRIQYPTKAIDGAREFVRDRLLPQDLVAVMAFNRVTDFTTDHAAIDRFLERFRRDSEQLEFLIHHYWVHNVNDPLSAELQTAIDEIFFGPSVSGVDVASKRDGSARDATPLLLGMSAAANVQTRPSDRPIGFADLQASAKRASVTLSDLMVRSRLLKIYAGLEYLRQRPGLKHLVFLGPPLPIQDKQDENRLAQRANHAHVTLHIIGTAGVPVSNQFVQSAPLATLNRIQGMQYLTSETGGGYTGLRFANDALADIDRASRSYYLIGYLPVSADDDGRYRRVSVRVARRDVRVRFRAGYYATGQPAAPVLPEMLAQARMESVADFDIEVKDITVNGSAAFAPGNHPAGEVSLKLTIDPSRVGFRTQGSLRTVRLGVTLLAMDGRNGLVGGGAGTLSVEADDQTFLNYQRDGIPFVVNFPVAERPNHIRAIVYAYGSDLVGTVRVPVR